MLALFLIPSVLSRFWRVVGNPVGREFRMSSLVCSLFRRLLQVAIVGLLMSTSFSQNVTPNLSGTWSLDPARTTAPYHPLSAVLKIEQTGLQLNYKYFENGTLKYGGTLIADGKERERYKTRVDRVYYRARWVKGELVIVTRGFQDAMGTQSYSYTDRWMASSDGNTLTHTLADKKVAVYRRDSTQSYQAQHPGNVKAGTRHLACSRTLGSAL